MSGGPGAAETGTLAIMAGGPAAAIARIAPVMAHLGQMTHMGEAGAGQATKLVNQTIVLTNYCVLAEALRLAEAYGVDTRKSRRRWRRGTPARTCCRSRFPAWPRATSRRAAMRARC